MISLLGPERLQGKCFSGHRRPASFRLVPALFAVAWLSLLALRIPPETAAAAEQAVSRTALIGELHEGGEPDDVADLKLMQALFQSVSRRVVPTTVAIRVGNAHGSGVIINSEGYVLTAAHVAGEPNREAEVRLHDGRELRARTLGVYRTLDAGLVKITSSTSGLAYSPLGDSSDLAPGQWCLATGHPGGFQDGRAPVLRMGRILEMHNDSITTDCKLIGGDSGGPLFDMYGKVIGIHSRIGEALTANLHVPVAAYQTEWDRLVDGDAWGRLPGSATPFIGVQGDRDESVARIARVFSGSPAEAAGLKAGDVIIEFAREPVANFEALAELVEQQEAGQKVGVLVLRDDRRYRLEITVGEK